MKTILMAALGAALLATTAAQAGTVEVTITGVQPKGGHILTALQTRDQFMRPAAVTGKMLAGDSAGVVTFTLDVPAGEYALSVLHDSDDNRTMTTAPGGKPTEGWGFRDGAALHGVPTFDQVSTRVRDGAGVTKITVPMTYPAG